MRIYYINLSTRAKFRLTYATRRSSDEQSEEQNLGKLRAEQFSIPLLNTSVRNEERSEEGFCVAKTPKSKFGVRPFNQASAHIKRINNGKSFISFVTITKQYGARSYDLWLCKP